MKNISETFEANKTKNAFENNVKDVRCVIEERINKTMVGRSRETEIFKKQFDRVLEGDMGLTVVSGQPGIGKSFFVERAAGLCTVGSATYVHGKFRQYDKSPLIAFSEVIEQTVRHILTLPAESLKNIKNDLSQKIGADLGIILSVCPYAQILLGTHKVVNAVRLEQLKYRVRKAVYQFLATVSTALFPLIVFIDDLQWADTLSVNIIETICQDYGFLNLHLVLAWRDDDTGGAYLNPAKLPKNSDIRIKLGGLTYENIDQYVRLIFEQNIEHKDYIIRLLYGLTLGNPFNLSRVLRLFLQEKVLAYPAASKKWLVRHDKMEKLDLPADIEQLLTRQIDGLEKENKELLHLIACYGDITFELLKILTGRADALLNAQLDRLCKNSLLVKIIQGDPPQDEVRYGFTHDIVLKLAYNKLEASEKSKIHYHIAETLTELKRSGDAHPHYEKIMSGSEACPHYRTFETGGNLAVAAQLLRVDMPLLKEDRTEKWTRELYKAGLAARQGAAVEQALEIFERCAGLLSGSEPEGKNDFDLSVYLELLECRFICGQAEEAKQGFEALMAKYPETENQIKIKRKYIKLCAFNGDFERVMETGLQILAHLNIKLDPKHLIPDLIKSKIVLGGKKIGRLESAPDITDQRLLCILEILSLMLPSSQRINDGMLAMITLKLAVLSARHGNSDYAPIAYASYAYVLFHILKDHKKGKRLEEVTLALIDRCENAASKYVALSILGSLTYHWTNKLSDTAGYLEQSIEEGEKADASLYSPYAITYTIITKYMTGSPISGLKRYINNCQKKQKRLEHYLTNCVYDIFNNHIRRLEEGSAPEDDAFPEEYRHQLLYSDTIELNNAMLCLQRLYLEGQTEKAYHLVEEIEPKVSLRKGFVLNVEILFYSVLARLAAHLDLSDPEKQHNKGLIKKHLHELKYWVSVYPCNHRARYLLAQAEYDALFAPGKATDRLYQEAMDFAEKQGNLSLEALANLLTAKFQRDNPKLSVFYLKEAVRLYKKWGAAYIGDLIAGNMGLSDEAACSLETLAAHPDTDMADNKIKTDWDILFHLGQIEKMNEDEGYLYLLDLLIRQESADYCAVFFEKSDEMYLKYDKRKGSEARAHQDLINMNHLSSLPHKIIRYVARTETEILPDGKVQDGIFANAPWLKDKDGLSLVCLPIKYSGVLIGIIYLEKTNESGFHDSLPAFVKGFVPTLLSKQTTIRETNIQSILNPQNENSLFTERELEVLKLVAQGLSNSEISGELHITPGTVKNYLSIIYSKLEADNRVKAVMRAKELNIIQI